MNSSHNIGVVDKHLVNHSLVPKELTRGVKVLRNPLTGWKEDGSAGTELIDSTWKHLEKFIPQALTAPRTEAMHAQWVEWVRYSQWHMCSLLHLHCSPCRFLAQSCKIHRATTGVHCSDTKERARRRISWSVSIADVATWR